MIVSLGNHGVAVSLAPMVENRRAAKRRMALEAAASELADAIQAMHEVCEEHNEHVETWIRIATERGAAAHERAERESASD